MTYKDIVRQRQAKAESAKRRRLLRKQGSTRGDVEPGQNVEPLAKSVEPEQIEIDCLRAYAQSKKPAGFGGVECGCGHCRGAKAAGMVVNHGAYKTAEQLAPNEVNRVTVPDDVDYRGVCR